MCDVNIKCNHIIEARRHNISLSDKIEKNYSIVELTIPIDVRVHEKREEKKRKSIRYGLLNLNLIGHVSGF